MCAGKVVIDAFRLTDPRTQALGQEPRQTTSNLGHLQKPSIQVSDGGMSACDSEGGLCEWSCRKVKRLAATGNRTPGHLAYTAVLCH